MHTHQVHLSRYGHVDKGLIQRRVGRKRHAHAAAGRADALCQMPGAPCTACHLHSQPGAAAPELRRVCPPG